MKKIAQWASRTFHPEQKTGQVVPFATLFGRFQKILTLNNLTLELMAEANDKQGGHYVFDQQYIRTMCRQLADNVHQLIYNLDALAPHKYTALHGVFSEIQNAINQELAGRPVMGDAELVMPYARISREHINLVGGKNARLAEMRQVLGLRVPDGFAITTRAFQLFMEHNGLWRKVLDIAGDWRQDRCTAEQAAAAIRPLIVNADVPPAIRKEVQAELAHLHESAGTRELRLAVRSSAWGEDGELSFAGQYLSLLNVTEENLLASYREVIASAFSASALAYRREKGVGDREPAMAVACQVMVDAAVSGVIYTTAPSSARQDSMLISAAWGLGEPVVSGEVSADQYAVTRRKPHRISAVSLVRKTRKLTLRPQGGTVMQPVGEAAGNNASLTNAQVLRLATVALEIEPFFRSHMDIEFAFDRQGELVILQARPLHIAPPSPAQICDIAAIVKNYPVLMRDCGVIAQKGIAAGPVFVVRGSSDLDSFPSGAVLVARYASPLYARVMKKASAIITDVGAATCHMATIAREFRVPTIVNTGHATELLKTGQEITIDAEENVIYEGTIDALCFYGLTTERLEETYEYRLLRRVMKKIEPLALVDPTASDFKPEGCRSFHDIIRFVHEKAVDELINLHYSRRQDKGAIAGKLRWDLPLDLVLIDIGGGIAAASPAAGGSVEIDRITSIPMQAFVQGLDSPGAWDNEPLSVDLGSFMSSLTRSMPAELAGPRYVGQNLAVISGEYANISLRLGYHFSMVDAYVSGNLNDSYIYFRFVGGVTDATRRARRARLLQTILLENDFMVEVHEDLVVARIKKLPADDVTRKIRLLGLLVGFTRQLDVLLLSDQHINRFVTAFAMLAKKNINHYTETRS
jgi:pyruvate,water dikinase